MAGAGGILLNYAAVASKRLLRMPGFEFLMYLLWVEAVKWAVNAKDEPNQLSKPVCLAFYRCTVEIRPDRLFLTFTIPEHALNLQ